MAALKRKGKTQAKAKTDSKDIVVENLTNGGEYEGRLVYVADLGLQERSYMGDVKEPCQKISLGIEVIGESITVDGVERPRILWSKPFNVFETMNEKGNELKYYRIFNPSAREDTVADWENVLGTPCSITVTHVKKDENVYDNIGTIAPIPKKYQDSVGDNVTEPCIGDSDDPENECTKSLFGLTKWFYDNRIVEPEEEEAPEDFEEDCPF